ncbi:MAG: hypothetical protein ABH854_02335 [Candidatus Diapherotrites archaeon]|nr:hypothetical protein [Candidatus Micrarchaeota archaeon]MBU1939953.1 hypothetical protein [Candidatus Micrarchaeota archaeon]
MPKQKHAASELEALVLRKLKNRGYWGARLMNLSDLCSGVPKEEKSAVEDAAEKLFEKGLLRKKPGNRKEFRYSLSPSRKAEINERVRKYLALQGIDFEVYR